MENRITEAMTYMIEQNKKATDTKQAVINAANSYESIKTAQKMLEEQMLNTRKEATDVHITPTVEDIKREMETIVMRRTSEEEKER